MQLSTRLRARPQRELRLPRLTTAGAAIEIDIVYTWVDDAWPGYQALLGRYASTRHDLNPNRYRDNLELLRYNLRSLEQLTRDGRVPTSTTDPSAVIGVWTTALRQKARVLNEDGTFDVTGPFIQQSRLEPGAWKPVPTDRRKDRGTA